jgi:hypothetical protein
VNRLHALVVAHVVAGVALSWAARVYPATTMGVSVASLFFAQCALLALWAGFGTTPPSLRYLGTALGGTYLWFVVTIATHAFENAQGKDLIAFAVLVAACVIPVVALFLALQRWGPRLVVCHASEIPAIHQPFQFSIKHLLLLALCVAAALAVGRGVRSIDPRYQNSWPHILLICAVLGTCSLHLILAAVWACLAADKLSLRKSLAFAAALLVGLIPPFYFGQERHPDDFLFCCVTTPAGTQAVAMLSLDVLRSAGFRVMRTDLAAARATEAEFATAHPLD